MDLAASAKKPKEVKTCEISKMTFSNSEDQFVYTFTYNKQGQPLSVISNKRGTYGALHYYFRYDKKHQLTDVIEAFRIEEGQYLYNTWQRFQYNTKGLIVSDSTFYFGLGGAFPEETFTNGFWTTQYTYDKQTRLIKVTRTDFGAPGETFETIDTYAYNNNGNLDGYTFDNKVNINRTNAIWMFLNRDYSLNNKIKAQTYNEAGLPLTITNEWFNFLPVGREGGVVFEYNCKKSSNENETL